MAKSRTKNSAINASIATISKVIHILMTFICRTIFIKALGTEYLGVNGLFTNILTILSFAELGIGNAIIFKLYKPVANQDCERQKTLLNFYKQAYFLIGVFILAVGLLIIPFLDKIVTNAPNIKENLVLIYTLFLSNTAISYFFTYKKSIIIAHQQEYVISLVELILNVLQNIVQIVYLIITHNYIGFLIIQILTTILNNLIVSYKANKMYPYIKDKKYEKIDKVEKKQIFNDVKSLMLYKLGYVLSNGTDNIIISSYLGVAFVGLLSNYTTVTLAITSLLSTAFNSLTASIGNLNTIKEKKKKEDVFYQILMLSFLIYGYISVAISLLINQFITIWLGTEYMLELSIALALGFNLYIDGMRFVNYTFRNTLGLFKKGRLMPLFSSLTNVILSIILVRYIGMFGVLIATGLSRLFILTWYDPYLIHKNEFKTSCFRYYKTYLYYLVITIITFVLSYFIIKYIPLMGILGFIVKGIVVTAITGVVFIAAICKMKEFKELKQKLLQIIKKKIKR